MQNKDRWNCIVPDGKSGDWAVESFTVSVEDSRMTMWSGFVAPGNYKRLVRGKTVVMSNTAMELNTHRAFIRDAQGNVLIAGLGLGLVLNEILRKDTVKRVVVIENSADVIKLVAPSFTDPRVEIIHADIFTYTFADGTKFDYAWFDIWDEICTNNLPEMRALKSRYHSICKIQGCWTEHELVRMLDEDEIEEED